MVDHLRTEHMDYEYIKIPLGGGLYTTVYAVPSGWEYQTGSSTLVSAGVGPISGGPVQGSVVFAVTQGKYTSPNRRYRLFFTGYDISGSLGAASPFGFQGSTEATPSTSLGQVYRLPRSGAPMPGSGQRFANNQEAGGPTGFEGDFMMAAFDAGSGGAGNSTAIMFLGGARGAPSTWSQHEFIQYKYVTFFSGMWGGNSQGAGFSIIRGSVSPPVLA
jgi:hypothetical protein